MKVAAVVVFYNPNKDTVQNINSYIDRVDKLYIVDNSDNSNESLLQENKKIEYIPNLDNYGIAKALNIGAENSIKDGYKWLLTMDQDSKLEKETLDKLINYIEKNDTKKVGIVTPWHIINTGIQKPKDLEIDYPLEVMTSGNLVNLDAYKEIGGWDNNLFIDDVDIDYCLNLNRHGYKVVRLLNAEMEHSLGNITIKHIWPFKKSYYCTNHNYLRRYYMSRNLKYLENKYKGQFDAQFAFMEGGIRGQKKNIIVFEKDKIRKLKYMKQGEKDGLQGKMGRCRGKD